MPTRRLVALIALSVLALPLRAQQPPGGMTHTPGMQHDAAVAQPTQGGQAAFATITEIVKLLEADPRTDWSKVNLEALRQHLIDMDAVTLRARVRAQPSTAGVTMDITGDRAVAASIRRMVGAHATMLESLGGQRARTTPIPGGLRLVVTASNPGDSTTIARLRGLGFIGLMTQGAHHAIHHLLIAKGEGAAAHTHGAP